MNDEPTCTLDIYNELRREAIRRFDVEVPEGATLQIRGRPIKIIGRGTEPIKVVPGPESDE